MRPSKTFIRAANVLIKFKKMYERLKLYHTRKPMIAGRRLIVFFDRRFYHIKQY